MPAVSIIIPLHNKGPYIRETLESVLAQTFQEWEAFVIENHSTDNGPAQVIDIASCDPRIHLIQAPPAVRGPGAARNLGIAAARGEWVLFLDADDLLEPDYIELHLLTAKANSDADILVCGMRKFLAGGDSALEVQTPSWIGKPIEELRETSIALCPWNIHAAMVRRTTLTSDLWWNEDLDVYLGEDINFWFKVLRKANVASTPGFGAIYRYQTENCRDRSSDPYAWFTGIDKVLTANISFLMKSGENLSLTASLALFRLYVDLYMRMTKSKRHDLSIIAASKAREWFNVATTLTPSLPWHFRMYQWFGLGGYGKIKELRQLLIRRR